MAAGEHGPTGPIKDMVGLLVKANGKDIGWTRDPKEMFAFRVDVPAGTSEIEASFDLLVPSQTEGFSSGASATSKLVDPQLEPGRPLPGDQEGKRDRLRGRASRYPRVDDRHRRFRSSRARVGLAISFEPVTLTTLIDSPVLAGEFLRSEVLDDRPGKRVVLDMAADARADLEIPAEMLERLQAAGQGGGRPVRRPSLRQLPLPVDALGTGGPLRLGAPSVVRQSRSRALVRRSRPAQGDARTPPARVRSFVEREVPPSGRPDARRLRRPDRFEPALGLRGADAVPGLGPRVALRVCGRPRRGSKIWRRRRAELDARGGRGWRSLEDTATAGAAPLRDAATPGGPGGAARTSTMKGR